MCVNAPKRAIREAGVTERKGARQGAVAGPFNDGQGVGYACTGGGTRTENRRVGPPVSADSQRYARRARAAPAVSPWRARVLEGLAWLSRQARQNAKRPLTYRFYLKEMTLNFLNSAKTAKPRTPLALEANGFCLAR